MARYVFEEAIRCSAQNLCKNFSEVHDLENTKKL